MAPGWEGHARAKPDWDGSALTKYIALLLTPKDILRVATSYYILFTSFLFFSTVQVMSFQSAFIPSLFSALCGCMSPTS